MILSLIMKPPFDITGKIASLTAEIARLLGSFESLNIVKPRPVLRKQNKIKTIKSSLAIEGNTFTEEQVTAILEGKRVVGPQKEIVEVKNAIQLYEDISRFDPYKTKEFLKAHGILMKGLLSSAGKWRNKNVGVLDGTKVKHVAPKPIRVPKLMNDLFQWLSKDSETHYLIKSAILHYEIEFIHPFEDGNGRMGRFWQSLFLSSFDPIFQYLPLETLIEEKQQDYYKILERCDRSGNSTLFIEFALDIIISTLEVFLPEIKNTTVTTDDRLEKAGYLLKNKEFTRKDYIQIFKTLSTATASRDLKYGVQEEILKRTGNKNSTRYRFDK